MQEKLEQLKKDIIKNLDSIKNSDALRDLEIKYLGRKGELTQELKKIVNLGREEKKKVGQLANIIKKEINEKISEVKSIIEGNKDKQGFIDVTLPGNNIKRGHLSPLTLVTEELEDLFTSMGFMILDGPELESDFFNFTALNIPPHHPARDAQDTFYIKKQKNKEEKDDLVMRTHTSPVQIRAMQKYGAPLRCVVPGRVFRSEATDACHEHTFNQIEGLMIDENISMVNLISVLKEVLSGIFNQDVKIRVRPGYFPFVEPGIEVDMSCLICEGEACASCKHTGWLEMLGAGMVHPNVLKYGGIDPDKYSGFAFGVGIERLVMMKYGINDIRLFNSGDMRFLEQF